MTSFEIKVKTLSRIEAREITEKVARLVRGKEGGFAQIYTPHTTCGLVINENADPSVMSDILDALNRMVPADYPYRHGEGNADSHIKAVLTGSSVSVPIHNGSLRLGTWQGIFLMEFDGPRERKVLVTVV
jgi:secondary thiamine-phosphate synthase enzyme